MRLRAEDAPDLEVIAAALQDAVVPISDMRYLPGDRQFALVVSRFRWELDEADFERPVRGERVNAGLVFEGVVKVRSFRIDLRDRSQVLELLTIQTGDGHVDLLFAGGGTVRLEVESIACRLEDYGEPWPTLFRPSHSPDDRS
ncbi:MAG: DUF2948 family protein [Proteobacteria bacterium]|nr:DUF2948 family protein [Pseudomonadota bacterium]MBI3498832.1 DUF2948 family protein [Pseudomonadota bacterium]